MNGQKFSQKLGTILVIMILTGCNKPIATPPVTPTLILSQPPTLMQPIQPTGQLGIFKFIRTVQVTPDAIFQNGALGYIHYIPAKDSFVVILSIQIPNPVTLISTSETCSGKVIAYKEYSKDMQPTGNIGYISCASGDTTSQIVGNDIFVVSMTAGKLTSEGKPEWVGWRLEKFDAVSWKRLAFVDIPLNVPIEMDDGPTISYINGNITVSGEYFPDGTPSGPLGRGSHHHFFSTDLKPVGKKILVSPDYPSHCPEVSMIQEPSGEILMFAASDYLGDLIVLKLDKDWNYLGENKLRDHAFFPTGSLTDGHFYYIAYTDTSKRDESGRMYRNVGFAAFDKNWNTLQDVPVTEIVNPPGTFIDGESPWVQLLGNRLYVSYLESELDSKGMLIKSQAYVNVYEINQKP